MELDRPAEAEAALLGLQDVREKGPVLAQHLLMAQVGGWGEGRREGGRAGGDKDGVICLLLRHSGDDRRSAQS